MGHIDVEKFQRLEARLKDIVGSQVKFSIVNTNPDIVELSDGILKHPDGGNVEIQLEAVLRGFQHYGVALFGRTNTHYWAIGTHSPHGCISEIAGPSGEVIYENARDFGTYGLPWGIGAIGIDEHRRQLGSGDAQVNPFVKAMSSRYGIPVLVLTQGRDGSWTEMTTRLINGAAQVLTLNASSKLSSRN